MSHYYNHSLYRGLLVVPKGGRTSGRDCTYKASCHEVVVINNYNSMVPCCMVSHHNVTIFQTSRLGLSFTSVYFDPRVLLQHVLIKELFHKSVYRITAHL